MGNQVSINEFVLDIDGETPRLIGGRCQTCGNYTFPISAGCPKCAGSDIEKAVLGTNGTLWAWTVQGFPPKSPPYLGANDPKTFKPFGVGYVELPEVIVEARLTESEPANLTEGMAMALTVEPLFTDEEGNEVVTFAFAPVQ
ncbi:MAG: Zn-ribbon domain-containing OB-fold protein [Pseudomonadales bacterium]